MNNELMTIKRYNKSLEYLRNLEQSYFRNEFVDYYFTLQNWIQIPDKFKVDILPTFVKDFSFNSKSNDNVRNMNFIGAIWASTPPKLQKELIESVILSLIETDGSEKMAEMEILGSLLSATKDKSIISKSITKLIGDIKPLQLINENEICKELYSFLPTTINYSFLNIIKINQKKSIIKLNKKGVKRLLNRLSNKVPVILEIENASELNNEEINEFLNNGINIQYVHLTDDSNELVLPYDLETYMECRKKIDEIIKNVGYTVNQKELFVKVAKEMSKIHYSNNCEEIAKSEALSAFDLKQKYEYNRLYDSCCNLEGLITGQTICGGYVEIMNNIMACCGIKSISVFGNQNLQMPHKWNQVNLDGEWYNADVTYDAENIEKRNKAYWLLRSDKDFVNDLDGKSFYSWHVPSKDLNSEIHECPKSVPYSEINFYLNNSSAGSSDEQIKNHSTIKDKFFNKELGER